MGLLDMLFGGSGASTQTDPSSYLLPLSLNTPQQLSIPSAYGDSQTVPDSGMINEVTVTGHKQQPPPDPPPPSVQQPPERAPGGYNNMDAVNQLSQVQQDYSRVAPPADGPHTGLVSAIPDAMPGAGTLRAMLGTLGDAFLVQSGHQPVYAQRLQREQIAHAAAGFDTDPMGAAARIAATGAPGSMQDAQTMYDAANNAQLRMAQQQANNEYRSGMLQSRQDAVASQVAQRQSQMEDRTRSAMGGILQAAAASGDPKQYAAARQRAIALGQGRIQNFDPDAEVPANIGEYGAGYGMTAGQVARNQTSNASIAERAQAAQQRNGVTMRGQNMGQGENAARVGATERGQNMSPGGRLTGYIQKMNSGQQLTAAENADYSRLTHVGGGAGSRLNIPGLTTPNAGPGGRPGSPAQFVNGRMYRDAHGNTATYMNGKWITH